MEIKITQEKLAKALNNVSKVAAGVRTTLPILNNVLIRVDNNNVTLTTTNLDMAVVDYLPATGCKNGVITVPARLIAEFVGNLPKGETVEIKTEGEKVTIKAGGYKSTINGVNADEFPELPGIDDQKSVKLNIGIEEFKKALSSVMIATSNDVTRPSLTGVYFNTHENELSFAATDGYRLAEYRLKNKVDATLAVIVPAASLRGVLGLISDDVEEVEILLDDSQVRFRLGEVEVTSKLIDSAYPDYRQLIPKESEIETELDKAELIRVTKLAALFAREVGGSVVCSTDKEKQEFLIASVANELGENNSEIKTKVNESGKITLNSRFLLDALNVMDGKDIKIRFSNKLDPMVITSDKDDRYIHIIMPLRGQ